MASMTEDYIKLIAQQAQINDRLAIRDGINIFNDNWEDMIRNELARGFGKKARARLDPLITTEINVLKKVAEETALVYKNPPTRTVKVDEGAEESDERYAEIEAESHINQVMKTCNRYNQFVNHMLIKCVYRNGKIEYDLITPDAYDIYTNCEDWKEIVAVKYFVGNNFSSVSSTGNTAHSYQKCYLWVKYPSVIDGATYEPGVYSWNKNEAVGAAMYEENPYKDADGEPLLPFVLTGEEWPVEMLLNFTRNSDLVVASIQTAIMFTLMSEMFKFGSFKQMKLTGPTGTEFPGEVSGGYATLWKILSDGGAADIATIDSEAAIDKFMEYAVKRVQLILAQRGIPPSAFTITGTPESGYRAQMDRKMLLDRRQDMVGFYRQFENELFEITRVVNNVHHPEKISEDAKFKIDYDDMSVEMTKAEENGDWTFLISQNAATPVDIIRKNNPDLNEAEAIAVYEKNKALNAASRVAPSVLTVPKITKPGSVPKDVQDDNEEIVGNNGKQVNSPKPPQAG